MFLLLSVERKATWHKRNNRRTSWSSYTESVLTYTPRPGCWAWLPHQGGRVQRSSPGPPKPACKGGQPPRTCPGRHTGSPGCAGFSDGLGSRSLPAGLQPRLHCCVGAALLGTEAARTGQRSAWLLRGKSSDLIISLTTFACTQYCDFRKWDYGDNPISV